MNFVGDIFRDRFFIKEVDFAFSRMYVWVNSSRIELQAGQMSSAYNLIHRSLTMDLPKVNEGRGALRKDACVDGFDGAFYTRRFD